MKIEALFHNIKSANKTLEELKNAGFDNCVIDIPDVYDKHRNVLTNVAGVRHGESLWELVMESGNSKISRGKAPAAAANPDVSGMSTGEDVLTADYKVVVKSNLDGDKDKAKEIIIRNKGEIIELV